MLTLLHFTVCCVDVNGYYCVMCKVCEAPLISICCTLMCVTDIITRCRFVWKYVFAACVYCFRAQYGL